MAFLSNDLVFQVSPTFFPNFVSLMFYLQPTWGVSRSELENGYVDVHKDYEKFLELVVSWISERAASSSWNGLVCEVMRAANGVWFGVGVYTVCEILFMAGSCHTRLFFTYTVPIKSIRRSQVTGLLDLTKGHSGHRSQTELTN